MSQFFFGQINRRFSELGTPYRNRYRQIAIVGVGGIGYWISLLSALTQPRLIILIDPDTVELHNLNRIFLPITTNEEPKVFAVYKFLTSFFKHIHVIPIYNSVEKIPITFFKYLPPEDMLLISCTDRPLTDRYVFILAKELRTAYLNVNYDLVGDTFFISVLFIPARYITEYEPTIVSTDERQTYTTIPAYGNMALLSALLGLDIALKYTKPAYFYINSDKLYEFLEKNTLKLGE